jgi:hypothetical protein
MEFKDRRKEIDEIKEALDSDKFEFLVLYGRRRIGKTELILQATRDRKRIYYLATGEKNLDRFYNVCAEYDKGVLNLKKDYEVLFNYIKDKAEAIILDEFQNMIKEDKNITNTFQSIIDINLIKSKVKLFLLGSSVSLISSNVLSYKSPLYGRRTGSMKLKPISFFFLNEFFPDAGIEELIEIYGFADGVPYYLVKIEKLLWKWLEKEIKTEKGFLRDEIDFLMRYEFENPSSYKLILEAIANGKTKINEIKDFVKMQRTDIGPYIKNLLDVDLIKREVPITENIKSRSGRYYIKDNFIKFWFRFIYPNLSGVEAGIFDISIIKSQYSSYLGPIFEDVAKQYLIKYNLFKFTKIGRWWHKDKEIDIVALNEQPKEIVFAECKWQDNVDAEKVLNELKEKSQYVEWNNEKRKDKYAVFAKSFSKKFRQKDVYLFDLKDMEKLFG